MLFPLAGGSGAVIKLGELVMILDLHRQGLSVSAIARHLGIDRKTVRSAIAKGLDAPKNKTPPPRARITDPFEPYLKERLAAYPGLTAVRLWREVKERGYAGGYSVLRDCVRDLRLPRNAGFEVRFETPPGEQAQVDFAHFEVEFADDPGVKRVVWLFSMVLGYSRLIWGRFVVHQDLQSVLRCHIATLEAIGGAPREILYDRMKTAVIGEDADGLVVYNRRPALWLPAPRLPALPAKNERQGGTAVSLHPRGLLPRRLLSQPRRSQRPISALARHGRQSAHARDHAAGRQRGLRPGKASSE